MFGAGTYCLGILAKIDVFVGSVSAGLVGAGAQMVVELAEVAERRLWCIQKAEYETKIS